MVRERRADFETEGFVLAGASTTRRPDAISLDYLRAWSPGPAAVSVTGQGLLVKPWQIRFDAGSFYLSDFASEELLFSTVQEIHEISLAFDQSGFPVVAAEANNREIWLYWFDPSQAGGMGAFVFQHLGSGRTPRILLDQPLNIPGSDVQLFYINGGFICQRIQGESYAVEHQSPQVADDNFYLEAAYIVGSRLHVVWSERDAASGAYTLNAIASLLMPFFMQTEAFEFTNSVLSVLSDEIAVLMNIPEVEAFEYYNTVLAAVSRPSIVELFLATDAFERTNSMVSVISRITLQQLQMEVDAFERTNSVVSAMSYEARVAITLDTEAFERTNSVVSVTSEVA